MGKKLKVKRDHRLIKEYYGLLILLLVCGIMSIIAYMLKGNIRLCINDNLDSNIPILKMIRDGNLLFDWDAELPFIGGVIKRSQYRVELSAQSMLFIFFPPLTAVYLSFILKVFFSGLGFFFLAKSLKVYGGIEQIDPNVWCFSGIIFGLLGGWPHTALGFASIPWWFTLYYLMYKTGKFRYAFYSLFFVFITSFAMLGVFLLCYAFAFLILTWIKDRKLNKTVAIGIVMLTALYILTNMHFVSQAATGSSGTIKSLQNEVFRESFAGSLRNFDNYFVFERQYHAGGAPLRYFVIPLCLLFLIILIVFTLEYKQYRRIIVFYSIVLIAIVFNTMISSCNANHWLRVLLFFAQGFNFTRFGWISPCLWLILLSVVCSIFWKKKTLGTLFGSLFLVLTLICVVFDPQYEPLYSMYNEVYCNYYSAAHPGKYVDANHEYTWDQYYSEELFEYVKKNISYDGSWSVSFGIEPGVLQFNGIRTLDGYYSNCPIEYHDQFEKLIQPELDIDEDHLGYWTNSGGIRMYCFCPEWDFRPRNGVEYSGLEMYIDSDVFREMGGKYVFSQYPIMNADDLNFSFLGGWYKPEISPYSIYVYQIKDII